MNTAASLFECFIGWLKIKFTIELEILKVNLSATGEPR